MSKNLMIVESPHKGETIAKYLDKSFKVMSSQGHIRDIEGVGKNRTQHFKIHYKFIGCIALPEIQKPRPVKLNTRQGVAVEYLPSAI